MTGQNYPIFTAEMQQPSNSSSQTSANDDRYNNQTSVSHEYNSSSQTSARDGYNSSGGITGPQERELALFVPIESYFGRVPILNPPSNHIDCETPHAYPPLRLEERPFPCNWSRDTPRGPNGAPSPFLSLGEPNDTDCSINDPLPHTISGHRRQCGFHNTALSDAHKRPNDWSKFPHPLPHPATSNHSKHLPAMNSPSNQIDFQITHANPLLPLEEPCAIQERSRDPSRGSDDEFGAPHLYAAFDLSRSGDFFVNFGSGLWGFPGYETYDGQASGSESHILAESDEWQTTIAPNFPENTCICTSEELWYL
jgi:hypothetical protein